jgi:hypothetical protein
MAEEQRQAFEAQVARIRESGWLGRSVALARLFDFLAEARRDGRVLREVDVAQEVFGRGADLSGDASVRVYIHRLRRKLAEFYEGPGAAEPHRLVVPLGEYRLDLEAPGAVEEGPAPTPAAAVARRTGRRWIAAAVAGVVAANILAWILIGLPSAADRAAAAAARRAPWAMIDGERPILLVIGDYYIFGEADGLAVKRMIRDFDINSPADLNEFLMGNPELQGRYFDLDTDYTPTGATLALKDVLPVVRAAAKDPAAVRVITSSMLTPEMMKSADIIYVGYLSALRLLEQPVFATSRLKVGDTYDDLVDRKTGRIFSSSAAVASPSQENIDYAYLRAVEGPGGNHIIVIAGTRDIGVMQMAESAARALRADERDPAGAVERLYEVRGVGRTNISARRIDLDAPR